MSELPQMSGGFFLTDAGLETDLIFNHGHEIPAFAAHTLLSSPDGRQALDRYFQGFLELAKSHQAGFVLDIPTWRAQRHFASELGVSVSQLRDANDEAIAFGKSLKDQHQDSVSAIVLNGVIGPCGDAYDGTQSLDAADAQSYHREQIGWFAESDVEMITALTLTSADEAIGIVRAAATSDIPVVVSFTVETDGRLPTGLPLDEAIQQVDAATENYAAYYMINCAHPDHFSSALSDEPWLRRIRGFRCNASRKSHAELDASETLDAGNPTELAQDYLKLKATLPWANVFGGCCGSDLRHVTEIANVLAS